MCSWTTAPFLSCLTALMATVWNSIHRFWNRSQKLCCLLLLASLPLIQRLISGIRPNLQGKQQQVEGKKGIALRWRLFTYDGAFWIFVFQINSYGVTNIWLVVVSAKRSNQPTPSVKGIITEEDILGNASIEGRSAHYRIFPALWLSVLLNQEGLAQFGLVSIFPYSSWT